MGYCYRTNLKCTKPELISPGSTFEQSTYSEIIKVVGDEFHYITRAGDIYDEILNLSKEHPDVVISARTWNVSEFFEQIEYKLIYSNGTCEEIGSEPRYQISYPNLSEEASTFCDEFADKIFDFVKKNPPYKLLHPNSSRDYHPASQYRDDRFEAYLKFKWENEDHRFTAENKHWYLIEIKYESKDQENLKRLRSENEMLKKQLHSGNGNSIDSEYDELPF